MDFDKEADGFLVDMRGELSKYQLWLRSKDNQLIVCALFWQMSSSAIFYLQGLDSLRVHRGRHYLGKNKLKIKVFYIWYHKQAVVFPKLSKTN